MNISYNWLKEYLDIEATPEELAQTLTDIGLEVEGVEAIGGVRGGLAGVVVGEVLEVVQHPNADKLKLTKVSVGAEELPIVCGAPNVAEGQKVLVATVGSTIFPLGSDDGLKIRKAKIRGEESRGMICAEDELGLGSSHDGIMILDSSAVTGGAALDHLDIETDHKIEIGLTPNRADAMSHLGVARDLKAYYNISGGSKTLKTPETGAYNADPSPTVSIEVEDVEGCPKYLGAVIKGIRVQESPAWLKKRLLSIGLAPINNIVDITNFVLHETGQPLHAFDAAVVNGEVKVRRAKQGEKFISLDEVERELVSTDLMICNATDGMCIAGVFGGIRSGVTEGTTDVFLESAWFDPVSIRKSAKEHGLHTDASFRFERGVDPHMTEYALKRALDLILEIAGGTCAGTIEGTTREFEAFKVSFDPNRCVALIGEDPGEDFMKKVLSELDITIVSESDTWQLAVPPYRVDVQRESDVIEEVLRMYGYNTVAIPSKVNATTALFPKKDPHKIQEAVSDMLTAHGFSEMMNNSLTTSDYHTVHGAEDLWKDTTVPMLNPLSNELDVMRQTLLSGGLEVVAYNQNRQHPDLKLYEFGSTYQKSGDGYQETTYLALFATGNQNGLSWHGQSEHSYYSLKTYVEMVLGRFGLNVQVADLDTDLLEDGMAYQLGERIVARLGWVSDKVRKAFDIKSPVYYAELDWDRIIKKYKVDLKYVPVPKFPEVRRDLSLLLKSEVKFSEVVAVAKKSDNSILKSVELFDVYQGENLESGTKSYAISFSMIDPEKTLVDSRVEKVMDKITTNLQNELGATLR